MKSTLKLLLIPLLLCTSTVSGLDFTITSVTEVGPIYTDIYPAAQWSPDGTMLGFFSGGGFTVSDTLGNVRPAIKHAYLPHRFRWIDNANIVLYSWMHDTGRIVRARLSTFEITTGAETVILDYHRRYRDRWPKDMVTAKGPYTTVEGAAYYWQVLDRQKTFAAVGITKEQTERHGLSLAEQHILTPGEDALYLVRTDGTDSTKISNKPYEPYVSLPISISPDQTHIIIRGTLIRLSDDYTIILDTMIHEFPEGTKLCGMGAGSFNPTGTEITFYISCDDGHSLVVDRMGLFDYSTNEFTILDTLVNLSQCTRPTYSSDGRRIAFHSNGVLYFLTREVHQ